MPYIPSKKTDGKAVDRDILDVAVERAARDAAAKITNNLSLIGTYRDIFLNAAIAINDRYTRGEGANDSTEDSLGATVWNVGTSHGYEGAFLGELNYAITRFIQRVPGIKVERGDWAKKDEFRYWLYAATISALLAASRKSEQYGIGLDGVFEDIKDEYKRRVNTAYEATQIVKSGDCYDTPYYTRLVQVVGDSGRIGYVEIMLERSTDTLGKDVLDGTLILKANSDS